MREEKKKGGVDMLPAVAFKPKRKFYSAVSFESSVMAYQVVIANNDEFAQAYLQGCEKVFECLSEAEEYVASFEEWEQAMLRIAA